MIKFCLISFLLTRLFYIFIIISAYAFILGKYELSSELIGTNTNLNIGFVEQIILNFLKHFYSYDTVHFLHIAKNNYTTDFNFAFFPLFPIIIKYSNITLQILFNLISFFIPFFKISQEETFFLLSGFLVSNILCLLNTIFLFKLSFYLTNNIPKSKLIAFVFLINPGTIFFITIYSENLYFCLQLLLILILLVNQHTNHIMSFVVFLILLMTSRSTALFLCCYFLIPIINNIILNGDIKYDSVFPYNNFKKLVDTLKNNISYLVKNFLLIVHCLIIFIWMTKFRPTNDICLSINFNLKNNNDFSLNYNNIIDEYKKICSSKNTNYNIYSHLQNKYWDVSFLSQYKFDKIDRIILSLPMNILGILIIISFFNLFNFKNLIYFKIDKFLLPNNTGVGLPTNQNKKDLIYNSFILSSTINFIINFLIVVFIAHPQINNRVYSTCPILYFYCADEILKFTINKSYKGLFIIIFFIIFSIIGCIMQVGSYGFA